MDGAAFAGLLLATCAALVWAFWPRPARRAPAKAPPVADGGTHQDPGTGAGLDDLDADLDARPGPLALTAAPPADVGQDDGTSSAAGTRGTNEPPRLTADTRPPAEHDPPRADEPPRRAAIGPAGVPQRAALFGYGSVAGTTFAAGAPNRTTNRTTNRTCAHDRTGAHDPTGDPHGPDQDAYRHTGEYACVHAATTGFAPARERIVELAVVRCDASGRVLDRWSTLVDPRRDVIGGAPLHGIAPGVLHGAPAFADVASELLTRCAEAVVVAHNADLLESFLAAELLRVGVLAPTLPALDLTQLAPLAAATPNARLATLARSAGRRRTVPSSALDDALIVAAVLPTVLGRFADTLSYPVAPSPATTTSGRHRREAPVLPRAAGTTGTAPSGWLADLMARLPMSAAEGHDPRLAAYLDALTSVLPTGRIVADEVRDLTGAAVRSGYPAAQLRSVLERLLESMRSAAFALGPVSQDQVRHLRAAALSLGVPQYFDDLIQAPPPPAPTPGSGTFSRPVRKPLPAPPPAQAPRCGLCLQVGHYSAACPKLRRRGRGPIGGTPGIGPIDPISPI